ncbi:hypothetical protein GCM10011492_27850 [Flexivirga endophytica]|uniref:Primosomal protein n=1 Tax=Flexivirga endophytica TaxID=1849103 RepID=A0A916WWM5_9MICO|nr:hypothetical protein [Flexivirga endophytica]GGB35621.1 hypothetical protein GCM10011492_27850 [Flexivirga endophytica]GHB43349.1 hypothetical protein GCM10008112_10230 [Flexivirga endophytica]
MTAEPRAALSALVSALERHLEAAASRRSENDPSVVAAYRDLADAFEDYDDALMDTYGEVTPLEVYVGDDDEDDSDDEADDDDSDDDDTDDVEDGDEPRYVGLSGDDADDLDFEDADR